jgi:hypothetical protein
MCGACVRHVTCVVEGKRCKRGLERGLLDLGLDGRKVLRRIFKRQDDACDGFF